MLEEIELHFRHKKQGIKFYDLYGEIPISDHRIINWLLQRGSDTYRTITLRDIGAAASKEGC